MVNYRYLSTSIFLAVAFLVVGQIQPGSVDPTFNPTDLGFGNGDGANGTVRATWVLDDGKILIGGGFWVFNGMERGRVARLNADGSLDETFNPGTGANDWVYALAVQSDGKVIIAGEFSGYNGTMCYGLARLESDGSLDTGFSTGWGANGTVEAVAVQPDGKILIGGGFYSFSGVTRYHIARLNPDGSVDLGFNPGTGANGRVRSITGQPDGRVVIGGDFTSFNGVSCNHIARLNADGSLDTGFDPGTGANADVCVTACQADGKIIVGGSFTGFNGSAFNGIARLNQDGSLDSGFDIGSGADGVVQTVLIQPDGRIIIGGGFQYFNGTARFCIARLNTDGSLDPGLSNNEGSNTVVYTAVQQSDGKIIIGGFFGEYNGISSHGIARIQNDGSLDLTFNPGSGASGKIYAIAVTDEGKVVVGGNFTRYNGVGRRRIARLNEDGSLDTGFNPGTGLDLEVSSIALQPDGKVIIGGAFFSCNGISRNHIARLMSDGTVDTTFDPGTGASSRVNAMAVQSDGKVIIGGDFTTFNGTSCGHIARLNADGGLDSTFNPGTGANGSLSALAIQADGKILIGGLFTDYNGTARNYIARLNMNGSLDGSFDPGLGPDDDVSDIAIQSDGQIVIGGNFTGYSGSNNGYMVRLNPDGSQDMGFMTGAGPDSWVGSIAVQSDGRILAAGGFSMYDGINRNGIVRLNPDGSLDESFDPGTGPDDLITDIAIQEGGKALLGGMFTSYNGTGRNRVARIIADNGSGILEAGHHGSLCLVPNPATEEIRFLLKSSGDPWEVTILDAMGRTVKYTSTPVHAAQHTVNVSDLPPGSYAVCLKGRQGLATARFVKVRP